MKRLVLLMIIFLMVAVQSIAQEKEDEHLLDGTSMNYYYQNGSAVHVDFLDGQLKYKWLAGPLKDAEGQEIYRSRKISDKIHIVNFQVKTNSTFVTLVFNFNQNVMYSSVLFSPGTDQEAIFFEGGIIEHLKLKEH